MYLKNLTIHGFKSFANKIILEFPANLIGIVGPNGSGKSNISDSIKWVLGEQSSKALRGEKMEDVIFSGTSTVPASQAAEVKLVFDNKSKFFKNIDSEEFVLVRRLNRSGDSEYVINGEDSRLKDIKEIIMDTGLGRDAYSIIGQGAVDNIITSRGNERRVIIEEAAGIVKYKAKKTDALRKVFEAQENVDRVSILITELESTLTPLSFKAQVAHRYMLLDEQLKTAQKKKYVYDFDRLNADLSQSKAMALEYHRKRDEHQNKITIFTAEIEAFRAKIVTLNDKKAQIKRDNADVLIEHEDLSNIDK
ncbi:MAG TPA: AAA family ATPase, partial [Candidatus Wallbacteria bacterium]|nr:AAA family ATPase [Candidatus Wallbacteria bacterium]